MGIVVAAESGSAMRLHAEGDFYVPLCGDGTMSLQLESAVQAIGANLFGYGDHVLGSSDVEGIEPDSDRCSVALNPQHEVACTMYKDLAQVGVALLTDVE